MSEPATKVSVGFEKRVLFIGKPFLPIQITTNGYITNMTTDPPLLPGLVLDSSTRQIRGIYNGSVAAMEYKIVATGANQVVSSSFVLAFQCPFLPHCSSLAISPSLFAIDSCTYSLSQPITPLPTEWYASHAADSCSLINELRIDEDSVHSSRPSVFTISMLGYIYIPFSGEFSFLLNCTTGARVLLDGAPVLSLFAPDQPSLAQQSKPLPLTEGLHFLQVYFLSTTSTTSTTSTASTTSTTSTASTNEPHPFFALYYRSDLHAGDWILIGASLLRQGGVGPHHLHAASLLGCVCTALALPAPAVSGQQCNAFSVTPALPTGLALDDASGVVVGQLTVVAR